MASGLASAATALQLQNVQNDILLSLLKVTENLAQTTMAALIDQTTQQLQNMQLASLGQGNAVNTLA